MMVPSQSQSVIRGPMSRFSNGVGISPMLRAKCSSDDGDECNCPGKGCVAGPHGCACVPRPTGGGTLNPGTTALF